jgi:predicted nucleotidyltransferase component of viral defense system
LIPRADIVQWRSFAPWISDAQVEQDLIISRLLVELYQNEIIHAKLLFRGGTALHKVYLSPAVRYSEDLDFVQRDAEGIGNVLSAIKKICHPLFGKPRTRQKEDSVILTFHTASEIPPTIPLRIKIEVNTREHSAVFPIVGKPFDVDSRWFRGGCQLATYTLEELLATKLRALCQRRKGRDLFDLWHGLTKGKADPRRIVEAFHLYLAGQQLEISMAQFRKNLFAKVADANFINDTRPLLRPEILYSPIDAARLLDERLIDLLGD